MNDLSLHLVTLFCREVPPRRWVLTALFSLRYRLGFDRRAHRVAWGTLDE